MHWIVQYINIPYVIGGRDRTGLDCWGLVWLVYREQFGIELPEMPGIMQESTLRICREMEAHRSDWLPLEATQDGCLVVMSQRRHPHHVGIWTEADGGLIVHACPGMAVVAETKRRLQLKGFRHIHFHLWHTLLKS
jgi:cell wall-associated NlpC family hydrolase